MFKYVRLAGIMVIASLVVGLKPAFGEACGNVTIARMNWASAEIIAEIDRYILSAGYGCDAQLVNGDTLSTFDSMTKDGKPDIVPELWVNSVGEPLDAAVSNGSLVMAAEVLTDGGEEGWWIPRYIADEHPEIKTAADALARPDLFPYLEDEAQGALHNCPAGWGCQISTANLFRAFAAEDKGFTLVDTGTAAGLDASIAKAYESGQGWLGYYWAPTPLLGRYDMVRLAESGIHDALHWDSCTVVLDCEEPNINAWPVSQVFSVVTGDFAQRMNGPLEYVRHRRWGNQTVNKLLAWMSGNQATGEEVALHFLQEYEDVWTGWLPAELIPKVKAAL